ncbi:MAG: tetratricopeptide repeat protein, partial [Bacteroidia bacterium]|nr:tetratricopeptide repeat protein [Bacteroidia bacterium]
MMKINIKIITSFFILIYSHFISAQNNIALDKENFPDKEIFQKAMTNLNLGNEFFNKGKDFYRKAMTHFMSVYELNTLNAELNYKIGICILLEMPQKEQAIDFFEKAYKLDSNVAGDILYVLARAYHQSLKFDKAVSCYESFRSGLSKEALTEWNYIITRHIEECNNGEKLLQDSLNVMIENLGIGINTRWADHSPLVNADESMMIFTSQRPDFTGGKIYSEDTYFEDIYI